MSKGSKIVPVRIDEDLLEQMEQAIESRNAATQEEPFNVSDYIRFCIRTKLAHTARSRSTGRKAAKERRKANAGSNA